MVKFKEGQISLDQLQHTVVPYTNKHLRNGDLCAIFIQLRIFKINRFLFTKF